jgi:hypothetical protein
VGYTVDDLQYKLSRVLSSLAGWGKQSFGNVQHQIRLLERELGVMRSAPDRIGPTPQEKEVTEQLAESLEREEVTWRQ